MIIFHVSFQNFTVKFSLFWHSKTKIIWNCFVFIWGLSRFLHITTTFTMIDFWNTKAQNKLYRQFVVSVEWVLDKMHNPIPFPLDSWETPNVFPLTAGKNKCQLSQLNWEWWISCYTKINYIECFIWLESL